MNPLADMKFDANGLIPAVIQDDASGVVLMLAYMNEESLRQTLATGNTWFYSRSRSKLWMKGESSGHTQQVRSVLYDCDADTLLIKVSQKGAACHEGYLSCFFRRLNPDGSSEIVAQRLFNPKQVYGSPTETEHTR